MQKPRLVLALTAKSEKIYYNLDKNILFNQLLLQHASFFLLFCLSLDTEFRFQKRTN